MSSVPSQRVPVFTLLMYCVQSVSAWDHSPHMVGPKPVVGSMLRRDCCVQALHAKLSLSVWLSWSWSRLKMTYWWTSRRRSLFFCRGELAHLSRPRKPSPKTMIAVIPSLRICEMARCDHESTSSVLRSTMRGSLTRPYMVTRFL